MRENGQAIGRTREAQELRFLNLNNPSSMREFQ